MTRRTIRRAATSLASGVALSMVLAGQSMAAGWGAPIKVAGDAFADSAVAVSESTVLAAYDRCVGGDFCTDRIYVKRSIDAGATWGAPVVSARGDWADLAADGSNVDLSWSGADGELRYARSRNGGSTFSASRVIGPGFGVVAPRIARGGDRLVAVSFSGYAQTSGTGVSVLVSRNGGDSFVRRIGWRTPSERSEIAIADGVIYVAYATTRNDVRVMRSADAGTTWDRVLSVGDVGPFTLTAEGTYAYLGYNKAGVDLAQYRSTSDRGPRGRAR
jgi:hypothetical protein